MVMQMEEALRVSDQFQIVDAQMGFSSRLGYQIKDCTQAFISELRV